MKTNHKFYSNLAFNLAEQNLGKTKLNPSVGCVVVKNNCVISSGITSENGRPHAEFNALKKKIDFKGADLYVTLEPCTHYGKTSPCANLIKKKNIRRVFYSFHDPDLRTNQRAKKVLKKKIFKLEKKYSNYSDFYNSYIINKKKSFPFIDAKIAISKDYFTINKRNKWITNNRSRKVAHLLRSKYDCIISTSETINKDNSLLNCRIHGLNNHKPDLIIIDRNLKLKKNLKLFNLSKKRKIYLFTTKKSIKKKSFFIKKKIRIIHLNSLKNKKDFLILFKKIFEIGKRRILIESGLFFLSILFKYKFVNNLYVFKSNLILKKSGHNNTSIKFIKRYKLNNNKSVNVNLENNQLFKIRIK